MAREKTLLSPKPASNSVDQAAKELKGYSSREALAILDAIEEKRKQESFIRYWTPYPAQRAIFEIYQGSIKELILLGGNRAGKTIIGAAIAVAYLMGKEYFRDEPAWEWVKDLPIPEDRPRSIWIVGLTHEMVREVAWGEKLLLGKNHPPFLPKNFEELGGRIKESDHQLIAPDGSILTCKSADAGASRFQGASIDLVWIDEECDASVYNECYQRTADCGGKILVTLTPLVDIASGVQEPWVFNEVQKATTGDERVKTVSLSMLDNPYIPEIEKQGLIDKWAGHPEERARLYGEFIQRSGLVYPMYGSQHKIPRRELSPDWYTVAVIDPANTGPTACAWLKFDPASGDAYLYRTYKKKELVVSEHAKNILAENLGDAIDLWGIDPKWASARQGENHKTGEQLYREAHIPVRAVPLRDLGEDYGLQKSLEFMLATTNPTSRHPKFFMFDDLHDFDDEMRKYVWAMFSKGEQKGLSKQKPRKGNDDIINAVQYGLVLGNSRRRRQQSESQGQRERRAVSNAWQ